MPGEPLEPALAQAFGDKKLGFYVLLPRVNLGGDSCFGLPDAQHAIAVKVK